MLGIGSLFLLSHLAAVTSVDEVKDQILVPITSGPAAEPSPALFEPVRSIKHARKKSGSKTPTSFAVAEGGLLRGTEERFGVLLAAWIAEIRGGFG